MIPAWAPNAHPMLVHFPIVLAVLAVGADVLHLVRPRTRATHAAEWLYLLAALGAAAAYLSGRLAARDVFMPGMAHAMVDDHGTWALWTASALGVVALLRLTLWWRGAAEGLVLRVAFVALGLGALVLVQQTAERGARLVYEQGVGVIPGPVPAPLTGPGAN